MLLEKGVEVKLEKRITRAYVLQKTSSYKDLNTSGGKSSLEGSNGEIILKNNYITTLVSSVSNALDRQGDPYPVTDNTGIKHRIDLRLAISRIESINELNKALKKYGLEFILQDTPIDMIVLNEKSKNQ